MNKYMRKRHLENPVRYKRRKERDAKIYETFMDYLRLPQRVQPVRGGVSGYGLITDGMTAGRGIPAMSNRSALFYVSPPMGVSTTSEIPGTQVILMP